MKSVEAARGAEEHGDDEDPPPPPASREPLPTHQVPSGKDGTPTPKAQRNFTDAQSRIMKAGDGFIQGHNAQIAVDEAVQIIVALGVSNQPPDCRNRGFRHFLLRGIERVRGEWALIGMSHNLLRLHCAWATA